jgi:hypothetical protein
MLPNFLIVGAASAGTTSLYEYLRQHPQVFMARPKELNFFSRDERWAWGTDWYEGRFRGSEDARAIGEASPSYAGVFDRARALDRIATTLPDVRLIFLARHPIARARSTYVRRVANGQEHRPIAEAMGADDLYVGDSAYAATVQALLRVFDRDRLLVLRSDRLRHDRSHTLDRVHDYLGLERWINPVIDHEFNVGTDRPRPHRSWARPFSQLRPVVHAGAAMPPWAKRGLHLVTRRRPFPVHADVPPELAATVNGHLRDDLRTFEEFLGDDLSDWEVWPPPEGSD